MGAHAVVIGGGIAGLLAAHALVGRFERVTIVERDRYPPGSSSPALRRGIPQSRCVHLLMAAGAVAFDELVPRWRKQLFSCGVRPFDACADGVIHFSAGRLPRTPSGITTYACSRALIENLLRSGFAANRGVCLLEGQKVLGLLGSSLGERVMGVRTTARPGVGETTLSADLVVDASGAGSTLCRWLDELQSHVGSEVKKTVIKSSKRYVSRWFHLKPEDAPDWHCLSVAPRLSAELRSTLVLRAEEDRWCVVLGAPASGQLPSDHPAFLDFTDELGGGELRRFLARATPVSPIHLYGLCSSRMMHYDRVTDWPAGLVALGDAVCVLDPYFGLGMTLAARAAVLLRRYLDHERGSIISGLEFQRKLASLNAQAWRQTTNRDPDGSLVDRDETYLSRLYAAAPFDPRIAHAILAVQHLLRTSETLMEIAVCESPCSEVAPLGS